MSSIIEGYNYDIFISYRQKDNKYDGWVTEFVDNLKKELEATFKEEISVYFDINPHDGLLETHDVDESLKEKLKCLVFIPIISRTYCDPKSFAWEHEFKAFIEHASKDKFGLKVKLPNGNVASRVLPIRIYDLESHDIKLCESVLGGVMRGVDFIYKSLGVNRPLRANEDHPIDNLNKTYYRDQINKVANAVKEIIASLKKQRLEVGGIEVVGTKLNESKSLKPKIFIVLVLLLALLIVGYFFIPKLFKSSRPIERTIAVLPFRNLSNDTTQLYFCDCFMEEILNDLQKVNSFTVRSRTSSDQYRDTKKSIRTIGNELNVNYLVEGSIAREGDILKIWVQLIDSKADKHIWSDDYSREVKQIFPLQSEIANEIATELKAILSPEEKEEINKRPTENIEAYNYFQQGNYYSQKPGSIDWENSIKLYEKAIQLDPQFALAYTQIAYCYLNRYWNYADRNENNLLKCKSAIDKAFELDPALPEAHLALGVYYYHGYLMYPQALEQFEIVLKDQPKNAEALHWSAAVHRRAGNWEKAKIGFVKAFELNPRSSEYSYNAGETFDILREYSEAEEYYNTAIMLQPDRIDIYLSLSQLYIKLGDTKKAKEILLNAIRNNSSFISDSRMAEKNVIIDIYDGKYEEALKNLSLFKSYSGSEYLNYAFIYDLMNKRELQHSYYDSARVLLEKRIVERPKEPYLYSSLSIAYAGLDLDDKAIKTSQKAIELMPLSKDAWDGIYFVENLALIYVMLGKYPEALEQIQYLLSIPGNLSIRILELDPKWAPLKNQPEFKKILEKYTLN